MCPEPEEQNPKPRRGRPALSKDALTDRRAEIAGVALKLFLQEGFASVSIRRIAKEVGLTPMALYRYFPSKLEILSTLWGHILGEAFEDVQTAVAPIRRSDARLRAACHAYVDFWFDHVEHYHLMFMTSGVSKADVTSFVSQGTVVDAYDIFFETVADALDTSRSDARVKATTDGLICHLHGIMHSLITMQGYDWTARGRLVDQAVDNAIVR